MPFRKVWLIEENVEDSFGRSVRFDQVRTSIESQPFSLSNRLHDQHSISSTRYLRNLEVSSSISFRGSVRSQPDQAKFFNPLAIPSVMVSTILIGAAVAQHRSFSRSQPRMISVMTSSSSAFCGDDLNKNELLHDVSYIHIDLVHLQY